MPHERCLSIICNDKQSSFTELLNKDNSVSIHTRNIQRLVIEMFRFYNGLSPPLMNNIFKLKAETSYNLRQVPEFSRPMVKSVYHGTESISYLEPKNMGYTSRKTKKHRQSRAFKKEIKTWKPDKVYIESVGFL